MINSFSKTLFNIPFKYTLPKFYFTQQNKQDLKNISYETIKANQIISKNVGMNQFLMRVYNTTGLSIIGALGSSFMFMTMPFVYTNMGMCTLFGAIMMLGGFISTSYMKPINVVENINGVEIFRTTNSPLRMGMYGMGLMGLGLGAAPLFMMAHAISPTTIPTALALTSAIFGGASLMAYNMPKDRMLGFGGVLMGSLLGLIGLQVVGLLAAVFTGPNALSTLLFSANNYLGIGLFSFLIAYDTHVAIKMY